MLICNNLVGNSGFYSNPVCSKYETVLHPFLQRIKLSLRARMSGSTCKPDNNNVWLSRNNVWYARHAIWFAVSWRMTFKLGMATMFWEHRCIEQKNRCFSDIDASLFQHRMLPMFPLYLKFVLPDVILVNFDIVSLFTTMPIKEALQLISSYFPSDITELFGHCLSTKYFRWNRRFYEHVDGVAIESPWTQHSRSPSVGSATLTILSWYGAMEWKNFIHS